MTDEQDPNAPAATGRDWLSMSTDNTASGRGDDINSGPITLVETGMKVVDAGGKEIGKVDFLRMGDPDAVTAQGNDWADGVNPIDKIGFALFGVGSQIPQTVRHTLLRVGYIHIEGKGWINDRDCYASAEQIASVTGDTVHLNVAGDALPEG